jgi:phosphoglycolate phosphatase
MLLLFDIDGTLLLDAARQHARALYIGMHEVYGLGQADGDPEGMPKVPAAGRTDLEIARETALLCGCSAEAFADGREALMEICVREYARLVPDDLSACVVSGMAELLAELADIPGALPALVTGNLEGVARLKLARAGIGGFFARGQGGFGSDSEDRTDLPGIARRRAGARAEAGGDPHPRERTLVIGDTPLDIACARADGVGCIAVTSGPFAASQLIGADAIAEDVSQLRELILDRLDLER